jgi:hypothetical protein
MALRAGDETMCCHLFSYMTVRLWEVFVSHDWMGEDASGEGMAMAARDQ